ncbi:MAG: hypothetical protein IJY62_01050 [Clostridia bacterium]|nr:hypothetical protein [Clostridia bacterium]
MKKRSFVSALLALALMLPIGIFAPAKKATAAETFTQTTKATDIGAFVKSGISGKTSLVGEGEVFDYTVGVTNHTVTNGTVSTLFTGWTDFDTVSGNGIKLGTWSKTDYNLAGNPYGPYYNYGTTDSNCMVRVNWMQNITYKLTFNKAALLTVSNEALSGIAASDNVIRIRAYKESGGVVTRLSETPLYDGTNIAQAANYFGGEYRLEAGESFYFEYGCTGAYEKSLKYSTLGNGIFPTFAADTSKVNEVSADLLTLAAQVYSSNGADVTSSVGTFTFLHGTYESNKRFDSFSGNALQTTERNSNNWAAVYVGGSAKQIRTLGESDRMIFKYTASTNIHIDMTSPATEKAASWNAYYSLSVERTTDGATYRTTLLEKTFTNVAYEANAFAGSCDLLAGDSVYLEIYGANDTTNIFLMPSFTLNPDFYEAENTLAFRSAGLKLATLGAGCRVDGEAGLRFKNSVSKSALAALKEDGATVELGTLLLPTSLLGTNLTENSAKVLNVKQTVWFGSDETNDYFNAVLEGLGSVNDYAARYKKAITARAYAVVTYSDGSVEYVYAQAIERSMLQVAEAALADPDKDSKYTGDQITVLEQIVSVCGA